MLRGGQACPAVLKPRHQSFVPIQDRAVGLRALITGAGAKPSTNAVRAAYLELLADLAGLHPHSSPLNPDNLNEVLTALSDHLNTTRYDTVQKVPGGLGLRIGVTNALQNAVKEMARRVA